jgi:epoxyqueuosine reductase
MEEQKRPKALSCGSCSQCICECPTGALVGERVLNASRCISYLTIEKRGALTSEERGWLGDWLFGCDICQDVCPFNVVPLKKRLPADIEDLGRAHGVGESLSLVEVLSLRDSRAFEKRFAGTALMRAKREGLLRNAAVVAANTRAVSVASCLVEVSRSDTSPIVRQHALWAAVQLASFEGQEALARRLASDARRDPSPQVIGEANDLLSRLPNGG